VGPPHPSGDHGAQLLGQPIPDVADLVKLAVLDHWVVEHVAHRAAQRLGPVDHRRIGRVTSSPRSRSPTSRSQTRVAFSVEPSTSAIESVNARSRRAVKARGHFPNEQAALECVYMVIMSLDPSGHGRRRWMMRRKPALNAFE
jgi:hypothetical protein